MPTQKQRPRPTFGAYLTLPASVRPGEPITVDWGVVASGQLGNVTATISYENVVLYTSASIGSNIFPGAGFVFLAGEDNLSIAIPPSSPAVQLGLYHIPPSDSFTVAVLNLNIVSDQPGQGPFTASANLPVVGETIDASWWVWSASYGPPDYDNLVDWNTSYAPSGQFFNKSRWSAMSGQLTLVEKDLQNNQFTNRGSSQVSTNVGPNPNDIYFASITQSWPWVSCPSGTLGAPTNKNYSYSVTMALQDTYGNGYDPVTSSSQGWSVTVPPDKTANQNNALASFVSGVAATATVIGAPLGGILLAAAAAFCGEAQDPPTPDFDYLTTAKKSTLQSPELLENETQLPATRAFLKSTLESIAIWSALGQTEGKLIAARIAKNAKGVRLQTNTYEEFVEELMTTAAALRSNLAKVRNEVEAEASLAVENVREAIRAFQMYGIPGPFEKLIRDRNCCCSTGNPIAEFLTSVDPTTIPPLANSFTALAHGLLSNAKYVHEKMPSVLVAPDDDRRNRIKPKKRKV